VLQVNVSATQFQNHLVRILTTPYLITRGRENSVVYAQTQNT